MTTVFFDFGGTLLIMRRDRIISTILAEVGYAADPEQVHSAYFSVEPSWLEAYGDRRMTGEETEEAYRKLDAMIFRLMFPGRTEAEVDRVSALMRAGWPRVEKTVPLELYPDALPTLEALKSQGYSLGMVSNAPPDTFRVIEMLGLRRFLPVLLVSGVVGVSKPNPEIFRIALEQAGAKPEQTVHVGDVYEADVIGARNAGIKGILLDRSGTRPMPDCPCIQSLSEIFPHLR